MNDFLSDALAGHEPLSDPFEEVNLRLAVAAADIAELRAEVLRLDRDLDEARRLNRRAAELLDLVYVQLAGNQVLPLPGEVGPLITFAKAQANPASPAEPR